MRRQVEPQDQQMQDQEPPAPTKVDTGGIEPPLLPADWVRRVNIICYPTR